MHHLSAEERKRVKVAEGLHAIELFEDTVMTVAETEIDGRFPRDGQLSNQVCKEIVVVLASDGGSVELNGEHLPLKAGDRVTIAAGSKICWHGPLRLLAICTPPWYAEQHIIDA